MAEKRKGCGFLIAAIVALVIAGVIGGMGFFGAKDSFEKVADSSGGDTTFVTPESGKFTAQEDKDGTVWLTGTAADGSAPKKPSGYTVHVKDANGKDVAASLPSGTTTVLNQVKIASFPCAKDAEYTVSVSGLPDGSVVEVSHSAATEALGGVAKAAGGFFGAMALGFVAFILGLIGLIRWLTSKPKPETPQAA